MNKETLKKINKISMEVKNKNDDLVITEIPYRFNKVWKYRVVKARGEQLTFNVNEDETCISLSFYIDNNLIFSWLVNSYYPHNGTLTYTGRFN